MLSWESALHKEQGAGLSKGIYTLHDAAEDRLALQKASGQGLHVDDAYTAAKKIRAQFGDKDESAEEEERDRQQQQRRLKELQETTEILTLQRMLPELLHRGRLKEAEGAVCYFLDRNPQNADGFVLLAETYAYQRKQIAAISALWGAVYNCPGNRRLLRLLAQYEENFLMERCELPLEFKVKALQVPQDEAGGGTKTRVASLNALFGPEGAPVMISRQGCHTAAFANKALQPGDLVFKEKPFVCTPLMMDEGQIFSSCFHCLQEREDPGRAFSCPVSPHTCPFVFCSWQCLMRNGRLHSVECKCMPMIYAAAKESGFSVTAVLHMFRTLVKAAMQREIQPVEEAKDDEYDVNTDVASLLLNLNSYEAAVRQAQPELFKRLTILTRRFQQLLPPFLFLHLTEKELIHLILVVLQYSPFVTATSAAAAIERKNPDCTLGRVLAPATALLHHSCVPTATISLQEDGQVAVRALTFIPAGGYVCLSVEEDLFKTQKERKGIESPPRVFGCGCVRCTENDEGGRLLRGIRCFKCVRGFLCPAKGAAMLARLKAYGETGIFTKPMLEKVKAKVTQTVAAVKGISFKRVLKETPEEKTPASPEVQTDAPTSQEEQWFCNTCGLTTKKATKTCVAMEEDILKRQSEAEKYLVKGMYPLARQGYSDLIAEYGSKLHPQHAVLFNAHTILAGLLASQCGRNLSMVKLSAESPTIKNLLFSPAVAVLRCASSHASAKKCSASGSPHLLLLEAPSALPALSFTAVTSCCHLVLSRRPLLVVACGSLCSLLAPGSHPLKAGGSGGGNRLATHVDDKSAFVSKALGDHLPGAILQRR